MSKKRVAYQPPKSNVRDFLTEDEMMILRDPSVTLPEYGVIIDQKTDERIKFDPNKIAPALQNTILQFVANPPRDKNGKRRWLLCLASRQQGKSVTAALAVYCQAAYRPGTYGAVLADTKDRADDLFITVKNAHGLIPERFRSRTVSSSETRQLTFQHGGKIRTLSAQSGSVGIGRAVSQLHISEGPFHPNFAAMYNKLLPAFINRDEAIIINESTPAMMSEPSAEVFQELSDEARFGRSRWLFHFSPFFASKLNERQWDFKWKLTHLECDLLDRFGPKGPEPVSNPGNVTYLTLENLAFRREVMKEDKLVRRWPDLFFVFYPTDPVTCWQQAGGSVIPSSVLAKHRKRLLVARPKDENGDPWRYMEYRSPRPGAVYVLGADPAGYGSDHAAFQILEVWADKVYQAASFSCPDIDPVDFLDEIKLKARHFNNALVVIERNGVGVGLSAMLNRMYQRGEIQNLYYERTGKDNREKPGWWASKGSIEEGLGEMIDTLTQECRLWCSETVHQLGTYRQDKLTQDPAQKALLTPGEIGKGRRAKHHWDLCSAFMIAIIGIKHLPRRIRPGHIDDLPGKFSETRRNEELAAEAAERAKVESLGDTFEGMTAVEMDRLREFRTKDAKKNARLKKRAKAHRRRIAPARSRKKKKSRGRR